MGEATPEATPAAPAAGPAAPTTTSERSPDFKAKLAQLNQDHANALAERTPEGKVRADYIQEQINDLHKNNPWGTAGNRPGALGRLGHIASKFGNLAGDVLAPATMELIPGTDLNKRVQEAGLQKQTQADVQEATAREAEENKTEKGAGDAWKLNANVVGPNGRAVLENSKTGETKEAPEGYTAYDKPEHLGDQGTYIAQWYKDHPDAPKSAANDDKAIEAYGAAKAAAGQENKAKGKVYYYDTPDGRRGYTYGEAKAAGLNPDDGYAVSGQQAEKDRDKNTSYDAIKKSFTTYQSDLQDADYKGKLSEQDLNALKVLTAENSEASFASKLAGDLLDTAITAVTGGKTPAAFNSYAKKFEESTLSKEQYTNMSPAARQVLADYYTAMMAHFANMKATQGTIPRNPTIIQTEMHTVPKPYLNADETAPAFKNYLEGVEGRNHNNVQFGKPAKAEETAPASAAPVGATGEVVVDGKVVGHVVPGENGKQKYQALQQ
jgi:hypothetical protein